MVKNYYLLITFLVFSFSGKTYSQEIPSEHRSDIKKLENQAEKSFTSKDYNTAIALYKKVDSLVPGIPEVHCNIGICYLNSRHKAKSLPYLETARSKGYNKNEIHYYLGQAYHYNMMFDKAKESFQQYINLAKTDSATALFTLSDARRKIEITEFAKEQVEDSLIVSIENIGPAINTNYDEYVPIVSSDQKTLYFTSRRPTEFNDELHTDGLPFEDIHVSYKDENGNWGNSKVVQHPINVPDHDACIGITGDGKTMFLYRTKKEHPKLGSIYVSKIQTDGTWSMPEPLGNNVNTSAGWESSVSVSSDNKILYFSSDRAGGYGGLDIWVSFLMPNNQWGEPINLGPDINTKYNEDCPYIHFDNTTLFFSSDGHNTMGGYDVFSSVYVTASNKWTKPRNIGYPINSVDDDMYFIYSSDGSKGYMSSSLRPDAKGKDIYVINRPYHSQNLITLRGKIINSETNMPVDAKVTVTDLTGNKVVGVYDLQEHNGKYAIPVEKGKNYSLQFEADNMLFVSENVNLNDPQAIFADKKTFTLKPIKKGNSIVLNNIFFDYNKYDLQKESLHELDKLTDFLKKNPDIQLLVKGFTDSIGDELYNLRLSKKRANEVRSYLQNKGIPKKNLKIDGYGESRPIASNATAEGQKMNRRTECEIFDIDTLSNEKKKLLSKADSSNPEDIILDGIVPDKKKGIMLYPSVNFGYNHGEELDELSKKHLDQVAAAMKRIPNMKLSIHGNTDNIGKEFNNRTLYEKRVKTVLDYFLALGLEQERFTVIPFKPSDKKTAELKKANEENRKVKFALLEY